MEVWRKQCLLAYLGYLPYRDIDDIWGDQSKSATERFQRDFGLTPDGVFGVGTEERIRQAIGNYDDLVLDIPGTVSKMETPPTATVEESSETGTFWDEIEFFSEEEFKCKCGGRYCDGYPAQMQEQVVRICDAARRHFGKPGHIISGLRCEMHNANEGGVWNSQHMYGEAVDLQIEGVSADQLLAFVQTMSHRYSYAINGTNVHVDIPKGAR